MSLVLTKMFTGIDLGVAGGVAPYVSPVADIAVSNFAIEGYFNIARIPDSVAMKSGIFTIQAITTAGTITEVTIFVNIAHRIDNSGQIVANIMSNTAHSCNSNSTSENGYVIRYAAIHYSSGYWYLALYKYVSSAITIKVSYCSNNDWDFFTQSVTAVSSIGSFSRATNLVSGFRASDGYVNGADYSAYSSYGVAGSDTYLLNGTDNSNKWVIVGDIVFSFNSTYCYGHSIFTELHFKELSPENTLISSSLRDFVMYVKASLSTQTTSALFNAAIPNFQIDVRGNAEFTNTDFAIMVVSTNTSSKTIRIFMKMPATKKYYLVDCFNRYGRSFSSTYARSTSYCYFNYSGSGTAGVATLPTPAQGSFSYAEFVYNDRKNIYFDEGNVINGAENVIAGTGNEVGSQNFVSGEDNSCNNNNVINGSSNVAVDYSSISGNLNSAATFNHIVGDTNASTADTVDIVGSNNSVKSSYTFAHGTFALIEDVMNGVRAFNFDIDNDNLIKSNQEQFHIQLQQSSLIGYEDIEELGSLNISSYTPTLHFQQYSVNGVLLKGIMIIRDKTGYMIEKCFFTCHGVVDLVNEECVIKVTDSVYKSYYSMSFINALKIYASNFVNNKYFEFFACFEGETALALQMGLTGYEDFRDFKVDINIWVDTVEMFSFPNATNFSK